jgi:hypothetical protein
MSLWKNGRCQINLEIIDSKLSQRNDIVDLALARKESNWKRPGYLNKIFTTKEQLLISSAEIRIPCVRFMESERGGL